MITQIVVHLLPHEIDWFEWQSKQFKLGSYYLDKNGVLFEIIRTEDSITINKVVEKELTETDIIIGVLVEKNI